MSILPKQTLTFAEPGRVHLSEPYGSANAIEQAAILNADNRTTFESEEQNNNALFLRTLSRMLAEGPHNTTAEHMYPLHSLRFMSLPNGSRAHLVLADFEGKRFGGEETDEFPRPGPNESTTQYQMVYGFLEKFAKDNSFVVRAPYFAWDVNAVEMLEYHQIPRKQIQRFAEKFLAIADMVDHDYLHQIIDTRLAMLKGQSEKIQLVELDDKSGLFQRKAGKTTEDPSEDIPLALQAQILDRLFRDSPRRKAHVLASVAEAYTILKAMQKKALNNCTSGSERDNVNEAITYFAEITAHRLFRAISPTDRDLYEVPTKGRSVAHAMRGLTLTTPAELLSANRGSAPADELQMLERHCSEWLGDTYRAIHQPDTFPVVWKKISQKSQTLELTPLEFLSRLDQIASNHTFNSSAYLIDAQSRAEKMRDAAELRNMGHRSLAHLLESEARGTNMAPSAGERGK